MDFLKNNTIYPHPNPIPRRLSPTPHHAPPALHADAGVGLPPLPSIFPPLSLSILLLLPPDTGHNPPPATVCPFSTIAALPLTLAAARRRP